MGKIKNLLIDEEDLMLNLGDLPLSYDEGEEAHFHMILDGFLELIESYGYDVVVQCIPPTKRFELLSSIIKSQGRLMETV